MIEFEKILVFRRLKSCLHIFPLVYQSNFLVYAQILSPCFWRAIRHITSYGSVYCNKQVIVFPFSCDFHWTFIISMYNSVGFLLQTNSPYICTWWCQCWIMVHWTWCELCWRSKVLLFFLVIRYPPLILFMTKKINSILFFKSFCITMASSNYGLWDCEERQVIEKVGIVWLCYKLA